MATLYIAEYQQTKKLEGREAAAIIDEASLVAEQTVSIGMSSTPSAAFNAGTNVIRVHTDAICSIVINANPTAAATNKRMAANTTEYFGVTPGWKLAVITNS